MVGQMDKDQIGNTHASNVGPAGHGQLHCDRNMVQVKMSSWVCLLTDLQTEGKTMTGCSIFPFCQSVISDRAALEF